MGCVLNEGTELQAAGQSEHTTFGLTADLPDCEAYTATAADTTQRDDKLHRLTWFEAAVR